MDLDQQQADERNAIEKLVEELLFKVDQQQEIRPTRRFNQRNENEIMISSDESDDESVRLSADEDEQPNSDTESINEDLEKCLTRLVPMKTKGELLIEELPAPEEEQIQLTFNVAQLQQIGNVCKILDNLVIVESFRNLPALDLDSILFFRTGLSIGRVFDVIGLVYKPFYVVRFASNQAIESKSIFINMPIYFVPNLDLELNVTKYVLVSQLKSVKGSDASWEHNNEPPDNVKEYSDDEEERRDQQKMKAKRKQRNDTRTNSDNHNGNHRGNHNGNNNGNHNAIRSRNHYRHQGNRNKSNFKQN